MEEIIQFLMSNFLVLQVHQLSVSAGLSRKEGGREGVERSEREREREGGGGSKEVRGRARERGGGK